MWRLKSFGQADFPAFTATLGLSFLMTINVFLLFLLFEIIFSFSIFKVFDMLTIKIVGLCVLAVFGGLNFLLFNYKEKYKRVIKKYEKEQKTIRNRNSIVIVTYVILSFVLLLFLVGVSKDINYG